MEAGIVIILYHGTADIDGKNIGSNGIDLELSKDWLDFSRGFYTTPKLPFAYIAAKRRYNTLKKFPLLYPEVGGLAIVILEYDERKAEKIGLRIRQFDSPTNRWARFIAANRAEIDEIDEKYDNNRDQRYDIVYGPTADGDRKLSESIEMISSGQMEISSFRAAMCMPSTRDEWGTQMSFHTSKALECLKIQDILYL